MHATWNLHSGFHVVQALDPLYIYLHCILCYKMSAEYSIPTFFGPVLHIEIQRNFTCSVNTNGGLLTNVMQKMDWTVKNYNIEFIENAFIYKILLGYV